MRFELHPDGIVFIRSPAGDYAEERALFEADLGRPIDLPAGIVSLTYYADGGIVVYHDAKQNAYPREGSSSYEIGDAAIAGIDALKSAQGARRAAAESKAKADA